VLKITAVLQQVERRPISRQTDEDSAYSKQRDSCQSLQILILYSTRLRRWLVRVHSMWYKQRHVWARTMLRIYSLWTGRLRIYTISCFLGRRGNPINGIWGPVEVLLGKISDLWPCHIYTSVPVWLCYNLKEILLVFKWVSFGTFWICTFNLTLLPRHLFRSGFGCHTLFSSFYCSLSEFLNIPFIQSDYKRNDWNQTCIA
jgi:hypothetical protein